MGIKTRVTSPENFVKTFSYESFMKKAFKVQDDTRLYVSRANMENLLAAELRRTEQMDRVKQYIDMALDKLIKQNAEQLAIERLAKLKDKIQDAKHSQELVHVINEALAITED